MWMSNLMEQSGYVLGVADYKVRIHILETIVEKNPNAAFTDIAFTIW
jgi:hypothetical protein